MPNFIKKKNFVLINKILCFSILINCICFITTLTVTYLIGQNNDITAYIVSFQFTKNSPNNKNPNLSCIFVCTNNFELSNTKRLDRDLKLNMANSDRIRKNKMLCKIVIPNYSIIKNAFVSCTVQYIFKYVAGNYDWTLIIKHFWKCVLFSENSDVTGYPKRILRSICYCLRILMVYFC